MVQPLKRVRRKKGRSLPDWAEAIHELYRALKCSTQKEFAARVESKQGTVSTWLRGDEARRPSADIFLRMSGKAAQIDPALASRFMGLANVSDNTIITIAESLSKQIFMPPHETDLVRVLPSEDSLEALAKGDLALPSRFIVSPAWTRYMIVDEEFTRPFALRTEDMPVRYRLDDDARKIFDLIKEVPLSQTWSLLSRGDTLLVDISQNSSPTLRPFWGLHVIVKTDRYTAQGGPSMVVGELDARSSRKEVTAQLSVHIPGSVISDDEIGNWVPSQSAASSEESKSSESDFPMDNDALYERAKAEMQLYPGNKIVGILKGWLPAPKPIR